ncbi:MAG: hypothetical protein AAFV86_18700 [Pseudomonadota bacterium]
MTRIARIAFAAAAAASVSACAVPQGSFPVPPLQVQMHEGGGFGIYPVQPQPGTQQPGTQQPAVEAPIANTGPYYPRPEPVSAHPAPVEPALLASGQYVGFWKDGSQLVEELTVYDENTVLLRRAGSYGAPTVFRHVRDGFYQDDSGAAILMTGPGSFSWANASGENIVDYVRF